MVFKQNARASKPPPQISIIVVYQYAGTRVRAGTGARVYIE